MSVAEQVHPKLAAGNLTCERLRLLPFSTTDTDVIFFLTTMKRKFTRTGERNSYRKLGKILHFVTKNSDIGDVADGRSLQITSWQKPTYCVF